MSHALPRALSRTVPALALMTVTAVWGSTFVMIKGVVGVIPSMDFLAVRFGIAALVALAWRGRSLARCPRWVWTRGAGTGLVYFSAQAAQTVGLESADASVAGFVAGTYVVLTPVVLRVALGVRVSGRTWVAVGLATAGTAALGLKSLALGPGESLSLLAALLFAVHIVWLGRCATRANQLDLAAVQVIALGVASVLVGLPGGVTLPDDGAQWGEVLYMALAPGLLALLLQTWAQARTSSSSAAVMMATEPLFSAFFAVSLGGEQVTARLLVGGTCILGAACVAEVLPAVRQARERRLGLVA